MATTAGSLQARKQDLVRGAIWDAAIDLFAEKGFDETTVDDIASAAGVSRRTFFRYFASKNDLMAAAIATYGEALAGAIESVPKSCSPMDVVRRTALAVALAGADQPRTRKVIQIARDHPAARQAQLSRLADVEQRVTSAFAARCKRGDHLTPMLLTRLLLATVDASFMLWFDREGQDIGAATEEVFATLSRLMCGNGKGTK